MVRDAVGRVVSKIRSPHPRVGGRTTVMRSLGAALVAVVLVAPVVVANSYAGWSAASDKRGIRGQIIQPDAGSVSTAGETILSWIGLCSNDLHSQ